MKKHRERPFEHPFKAFLTREAARRHAKDELSGDADKVEIYEADASDARSAIAAVQSGCARIVDAYTDAIDEQKALHAAFRHGDWDRAACFLDLDL